MKEYRDEIAEICHEIVKDGYHSGLINDSELKEFEADCFALEFEPVYGAGKSLKAGQLTKASV